jgi:hypothetical protein
LLRHPRFHLHFTPTYASWLNLVERFFGMLTEQALRRGSHTSVAARRDAILAYVAAHNDKGKPFTLDQERRRNPRQDATIWPADSTGAAQ